MSPIRFDSVVTHLISMLELLDSNFGWGFFFAFSIIFPEEYRFYVLVILPEETFLNSIELPVTKLLFTFKSLQRKPSYVFMFIFVCVWHNSLKRA
jgi:hypothetical protein